MLGQNESIREYAGRFLIAQYMVVLIIGVLTLRLFYLQVWKGGQYSEFSKNQFLRREKILGPRGRIYDRNRTILVDNYLRLDFTVTPQFISNPKEVIREISNISAVPYEELLERYYHKTKGVAPFQSLSLLEGVDWKQAVNVETRDDKIPGVLVETKYIRRHIYKEQFTHLLGYMNEVSKRDIKQSQKVGLRYDIGDLVGRKGIERIWEAELKGEDGAEYVEVDVHGHRLTGEKEEKNVLYGIQESVEERPGHDVVLTIDSRLQQTAYEALGDSMGTVVLMDPRSGEILSMVSKPSYDPGVISDKDEVAWNNLATSEFGVLRNKAIQDHFPPGSTFKPFFILSALEKGILDKDMIINCGSTFRLGRRVYRDHVKTGYGRINMVKALKVSSNVFMYNLAERMELDDISSVAKDFGMGRKTGIGLDHEVTGFFPTESWAANRSAGPWQRGETLSIAIGQGATMVTPLQQAQAYGMLATGGLMYKPMIISKVTDAKGRVLKEFKPELVRKRKIDPNLLEPIKLALNKVVNESGGTGVRLRRTDKFFSGKTGTAQVIGHQTKKQLFTKCSTKPLRERHHAWFVGYGPSENPEIVVSVLLWHGCSSSYAVRVAKQVLNKWLEIRDEKKTIQASL